MVVESGLGVLGCEGGQTHEGPFEMSAFVVKKCQHCCERPVVKTPCQPANVCQPVHAQRDYSGAQWALYFRYAAYTVLGIGGALGAYSCFSKFRGRRRVAEDKDNWEDDEQSETGDARNRDTISENSNICVQQKMISICVAITGLYVLSLYVWKHDLQESEISIYTKRTVSIVIVTVVANVFAEIPISVTLIDFRGFFYGLIYTACLFAGEIFSRLDSGGFRSRLPQSRVLLARNLVIAPVVEEIVFRRQFAEILHKSGYGKIQIFVIASILFWVAHFHHLFRNGTFSVAGIFALVYTLALSAVAFALLFKFTTVAAPIASHMVCNFMGVPNFRRAKLLHALSVIGFETLILAS